MSECWTIIIIGHNASFIWNAICSLSAPGQQRIWPSDFQLLVNSSNGSTTAKTGPGQSQEYRTSSGSFSRVVGASPLAHLHYFPSSSAGRWLKGNIAKSWKEFFPLIGFLCDDKLPQNCWLKTMHVYLYTVPQVRSLKGTAAPSGISRVEYLPCLS